MLDPDDLAVTAEELAGDICEAYGVKPWELGVGEPPWWVRRTRPLARAWYRVRPPRGPRGSVACRLGYHDWGPDPERVYLFGVCTHCGVPSETPQPCQDAG